MSTSKVIYNKYHLDYPVSLIKYYLYEEDYVILSLANNLNQNLSEICFKIYEYNNADELIEEVTINVNDLNKKANEEFILPNRLTLKTGTKYIKYELIKAVFSDVLFENNKLERKILDFQAEVKADRGVIKKTPKKEKKVNDKQTFVVEAFKKQSRLILGPILSIFLSVIAIGFFIAFLIYYKLDLPIVYSKNGFAITFSEYEDRLIITDFSGDATNLVIEDSYFGSKVIGIHEEAFLNANVKNVVIKANEIYIGQDAFKGSKLETITSLNIYSLGVGAFSECVNLKSVTIDADCYVLGTTFDNCPLLTYLDLGENSIVSGSILVNNTELRTLKFGTTSLPYIYRFFGETDLETSINDLIPNYVEDITCQMANISNYFLTGFYMVERENFHYPEDAYLMPGALDHLR